MMLVKRVRAIVMRVRVKNSRERLGQRSEYILRSLYQREGSMAAVGSSVAQEIEQG
jgi:hypothetical protein